jgi:hypothetical protein
VILFNVGHLFFFLDAQLILCNQNVDVTATNGDSHNLTGGDVPQAKKLRPTPSSFTQEVASSMATPSPSAAGTPALGANHGISAAESYNPVPVATTTDSSPIEQEQKQAPQVPV